MKAIVLTFLILAACTSKENAPVPAGLDLLGTENLKQTSRRNFKLKESDVDEQRLADGSTEVTIRAVTVPGPEAFVKAVELREFELSRPFRAERSPYPGAVTAGVQCPENFRPRISKSEGADRLFWRAEVYTSSRKTAVCSEVDFALKSVEIIVYCTQTKRLFTVHGYFPKADSKLEWSKWLASPDCPSRG